MLAGISSVYEKATEAQAGGKTIAGKETPEVVAHPLDPECGCQGGGGGFQMGLQGPSENTRAHMGKVSPRERLPPAQPGCT